MSQPVEFYDVTMTVPDTDPDSPSSTVDVDTFYDTPGRFIRRYVSLRACRACGAVVWDQEQHLDFHHGK